MIVKWIVFAFVVFVIICLVLMFLPIKVSFCIHVDALKNICTYAIYVYFVRFLCGKMRFEGVHLKVFNEHDRFQNNPPIAKIIPHFVSRLFTRFAAIRVFACFEGGKNDDAAVSAWICGGADSVFCMLFSFLKANNKDCFLDHKVVFKPNENALYTCAKGAFIVTMFDVITSFVFARIDMAKHEQTKTGKERKNG